MGRFQILENFDLYTIHLLSINEIFAILRIMK